MKNVRQASLTLPDLVVLSLLLEQPMHGYQLVTELEARDVQDWASVSRPQVYYSLNKLLQLRMIGEARDRDPALGPERTKYAVHERGANALEESLSQEKWATQRPPPPFQTWMALSSHLSKPKVRALFAKRRTFLKAQLQRERATLQEFAVESGAMTVAGRLMVDLCIQLFEIELKWLDLAEPEMLAR
jgi:DNA-binding PadR family transcriptional regulator